MGNAESGKVNKDEFLKRVLCRLQRAAAVDGAPSGEIRFTVNEVAEAEEAEFKAALIAGEKLSWTGIGTVYVAVHQGHPVQFGRHGESVKPYLVCKFSPSNMLTRAIRENCSVV